MASYESEKFKTEFSPSVLKTLSGLELLKKLAFPYGKDAVLKEQFGELYEDNYYSLKYILEYKLGEFGSGNAGNDTNFPLAFRNNSWYNFHKKIDFQDALNLAQDIKNELIEASDFLENNDFEGFLNFTLISKIRLFNKGYIHKYFHIFYPKYIGFIHSSIWQNYYKNRLDLSLDGNFYSLDKYLFEKNQSISVEESSKNLIEKYGTPNAPKGTEIENLPLNQIFYGPAGCGKTYKIQEIIENYIYPQVKNDKKKLNSLFANENFILTSWWVKIACAFLINKNKPLTNKEIAKLGFLVEWYRISDKYKDEYSFGRSINAELQKRSKRIGKKQYKRHEDDFFTEENNKFCLSQEGERELNLILDELNINFDFSKNETIKDEKELAKHYFAFCTFHQSYSYQEFVEGIRPVAKNEAENENSPSNICFQHHSGIFKNMCTRANKEPDKKFFIFIDEINRGNISEIFGELITLIEKDKRENITNDNNVYNTVEVILPYSNDHFSIPNNLYIIGTMNTIDKSLAFLDLALRRRFEFVPFYPRYDIEGIYHVDFLQKLNEEILKIKDDSDYLIGHAYFMGEEAENLNHVLNRKIIPLLMEYFNNKKEEVQQLLKSVDSTFEFKENIYHLEVK